MTSYYNILGRKVPAYQLSIATFGLLFGGIALSTAGPKKAAAVPQIQAGSSEEEKFILDFLKNQEGESKAAEKH